MTSWNLARNQAHRHARRDMEVRRHVAQAPSIAMRDRQDGAVLL
jgi:hypothetical protein